MKKLTAILLTVVLVMSMFLSGCRQEELSISELTGAGTEAQFGFVDVFNIDTQKAGGELTSLFNNINLWSVGVPAQDENYDVYEFTDYVQLMQCSGGTADRDLFKDPLDTSVLDDYDFTKLIDACRGIVEKGAKPFLKLGSVPLKYSTGATNGEFNMNIYPPDDYDVYYDYIYALASALVDEFGKTEVLSWRFGVMTEYENEQWFMHPSGDPEQTKIAYFKLYDYTVQALIDAIGKKVFVGAHSMTCGEGLWDEADFIEHVAVGTNYATGKKGTRICYLSASWYHSQAGVERYAKHKSFDDTMNYLRDAAQKYGLDDLLYGIDEGRILIGRTAGFEKHDLNNRIVGYTYQAAFDAKLYKEAMDNDIDYFSTWSFVTGGLPTMSYYVAKNTAEFAGMNRIQVAQTATSSYDNNTQAIAAYDKDTKTVRIMAYDYKETLEDQKSKTMVFKINMPVESGTATVKTSYINNDCNYFDEWLEDRKVYNITDDWFKWSPDDPGISACLHWGKASEEFEQTFYNELMPKYKEAAKLTPVTSTVEIKDGELAISDTIDGNSVVFYEITFE